MDKNLSCCMIHRRSKKWYWPIFRFGVDTTVQNVFQLYHQQERIAAVKAHDLLSFCHTDTKYFDTVVEAVKKTRGAHYNEHGQRVFRKPSLVSMMGNLLSKCCGLKKHAEVMEKIPARKSTTFWCCLVLTGLYVMPCIHCTEN